MEIFLLVWGVFLIFLSLSGIRKYTLGILAVTGVSIDAIIGAITLYGKNTLLMAARGEVFRGFVFVIDPYALFFKELFCVILLLVFLLSLDYSERHQDFHREYYPLLLFSGIGMIAIASAGDLLLMFISMELICIPLYMLAGFRKNRKESAEASLKYFVLGAFSSAFFLLGISFLFGVSGSFAFINKAQSTISLITQRPDGSPIITGLQGLPDLFMLGMIFFLIGSGLKIAAAPFHMWAPDVHEGAPFPVTAFISVGPQAAGIAVFLRFFVEGVPGYASTWAYLIAIVGILSIFIGNMAALRQDNIKRLLAYSSIAQTGYMLIGITGLTGDAELATFSVIFYITVYTAANLGAFAVAMLCSQYYGSENSSSFKGLWEKSPAIASIMLLALLSMAGIPPLAGFTGKFFLFSSAYSAFQNKFALFVLIAIILSVISLSYYLRVLRHMFFETSENEKQLQIPGPFKIALSVSTLVIISLGLMPQACSLIEKVSRFLGVNQ